jgi:hypothetical protein
LTSTLHFYKKIISTLVTLPITQSRLYFASSLVRAPRHRSSTCHHLFFHHCLMLIIHPHNNTHNNKLADSLLLSE